MVHSKLENKHEIRCCVLLVSQGLLESGDNGRAKGTLLFLPTDVYHVNLSLVELSKKQCISRLPRNC